MTTHMGAPATADVLRRLLDGATPGPWHSQERERHRSGSALEPMTTGYYVVDSRGITNVAESSAGDVDLIAVAPTLAQALLDVLACCDHAHALYLADSINGAAHFGALLATVPLVIADALALTQDGPR